MKDNIGKMAKAMKVRRETIMKQKWSVKNNMCLPYAVYEMLPEEGKRIATVRDDNEGNISK